MRFKPGNNANPRGRPKGTGRKIWDTAKILEEEGFNPIIELINLARNAETQKIKCDALAILVARIAPALKSVEHSVSEGSTYILNVTVSSPLEATSPMGSLPVVLPN
jgi:hypothetical protein